MSDNDWVTLALTDAALVADLLLRMRSSSAKSPPFPPLEWTVRQRRSKSVSKHDTLSHQSKNVIASAGGSARASPSTPLSWSSGGGGGVECCEESKELVNGRRSKLPTTCEITTTITTTTTKRPRKRKTLAELKEEESLLSAEKRQLKNELEILRITLEKERATNESLKRKKTVQLVASSTAAVMACSDQPQQINSACGASTVFCTDVAWNIDNSVPQTIPENTPSKLQDIESNEAAFLLPDLNMPAGEDASSVISCEVS